MSKKTNKEVQIGRFVFDIIVDVTTIIVIVLLIRFFVFAPFKVSGPSMCDTLNVYEGECIYTDGELVIASRFATWKIGDWYPNVIDRGDVIIFKAPYDKDNRSYVKRVIGVPGDTVKVENGLVYLMDENGDFVELNEPYLNEENAGNTQAYRSASETFTVTDDAYFVMGDNRGLSSDSRRCFKQLGCEGNNSHFLSHDRIQGEVKLVLLPLSHFRFIKSVDPLN